MLRGLLSGLLLMALDFLDNHCSDVVFEGQSALDGAQPCHLVNTVLNNDMRSPD